ncbi:hypothetical protein T492DRAFT_1044540 [Pavlovales sp. CCMP2436]|nr:hypothetical protein T492DRAFT_1044540 [Pavlovales sp. CCMP2436]
MDADGVSMVPRLPEMVDGEVEADVGRWLAGQTAVEAERLKRSGIERILTLSCSGFCTEDTGAHVWNRMEVLTAFDFDKVRQVLLSPPQPCPLPLKERFSFVHVVLQVEGRELSSLCMLMPYLYLAENKRNTLKNWTLVNSTGKESRHRVDSYSS